MHYFTVFPWRIYWLIKFLWNSQKKHLLKFWKVSFWVVLWWVYWIKEKLHDRQVLIYLSISEKYYRKTSEFCLTTFELKAKSQMVSVSILIFERKTNCYFACLIIFDMKSHTRLCNFWWCVETNWRKRLKITISGLIKRFTLKELDWNWFHAMFKIIKVIL